VVGCLAPGLVLTHEADDDDIGYQPLALGTLRPGVAGIVRDADTLAPVARIMGVHLKALPDSTDRRLQQAKILVDRFAALEPLDDQLPLFVLGDFNAHRAVDTGRDKDDWTLIGDVFATHPELGLAHVEHPFENTYRDKDGKAYKLDHMFLAGAKVEDVDVIGPCNDAWPADQVAIAKHFDEISDHCPVVANVVVH
jgi:endonuclease/exonuclease/phosphatase family metal-dependent hydrolase